MKNIQLKMRNLSGKLLEIESHKESKIDNACKEMKNKIKEVKNEKA